VNALGVLAELGRSGELLRALLRKEIAVRYRQSLVGPLWAFLQPLILMLLFVMIHSFVAFDSGGAPYPLVVYAALLPWTLLATSLNVATGSIVGNATILRKIRCPRAAFPLAAVLACLVDFLIASAFLVALIAYYGVGLSWYAAWVPALLLLQLLLVFGLALLTSSLAAYRRDVLIGMPYLLQFWMFASPVMYRIESVPERWRALYELNPMAGIIESYRSVLVYGAAPDPGLLAPAAAVAVLLFAAGLGVFAALESRFADVV
jgi:ABC-type polysaccharide/polyol phosphate export permease